MNQVLDKWDLRFLELALVASSWSKDPNTKMGAALVSQDRRFVALGYNGFPRRVQDNERLTDRGLKRMMMVHAEINAVLNCPFVIRDHQCTMYVTGCPCHECAKALIQAGIQRLVYKEHEFVASWAESMALSKGLLEEAGVQVLVLGL